MLRTLTEAQPSTLDGWLWLAAASDDPADKRAYLQRAQTLNAADPRVQAALHAIASAPALTVAAAPAPQPAVQTASPSASNQPTPSPSASPAHQLAAPRFTPTGVRSRRLLSWRIVALASLLLAVAIPLFVLLTS